MSSYDSKRFNCTNPDIRQANIWIADNLHGLGNRLISGYYCPDSKPNLTPNAQQFIQSQRANTLLNVP